MIATSPLEADPPNDIVRRPSAHRSNPNDDIRLAEAFELVTLRFRATGLYLALLDSSGHVILHDESSDSDLRNRLLVTVRTSGKDLCAAIASSTAPRILSVSSDPAELATLAAGFQVPSCTSRVIIALAPPGGPLTPELMLAITSAVRDTLADQLASKATHQQLDSLTSQLADTYEELSLLDQVTAGMSVNRSPEDFFRTLCSDVCQVLGTACVGATLRVGRTRGNTLIVHGRLDADPVRLTRFIDETSELLIDRALSETPNPGPVVVNDVAADELYAFMGPDVRQLLIVPLARDGQVIGFLFAINKQRAVAEAFVDPGRSPCHDACQFDSADAKLLASVASASAVYAENAIFYDDIHGLMMGLLHSLTAAVDAKDAYTRGHSERVAILSKMLALEAGLSEEEANRIYLAGLLHDVGKIGVPEAVLHKAGRLTNEEFEQMKQHPQIGARILASVHQVQDILPGVLHHHERFDGKGYPANLAGNDIPLMGRLICLADSFDAMTTNRTYRRGMPLGQALDEIARCAGAHFDPHLAKIMVSIGADRIDAALESHRAGLPLAATFSARTAQAA